MIIYEIVCNISGERYIGSTSQKLNRRMSAHRDKRKNVCKSKQIIIREDYQVNILEEGDFGKEREQYYMDSLPNINNRRANGEDIERYKKYDDKRRHKPERILQKKKMSAWRYMWRKEWGGHPELDNNLLRISADLFE